MEEDMPEEYRDQLDTPEKRMEVDPYGEAISRCKVAIMSALELEGRMSEGEHQILIAIKEIIDAA